MTRYLAMVPPVPALLPEYTGQIDPIPELRNACRAAVSWLTGTGVSRVAVLGERTDPEDVARGSTEPLAMQVAGALLGESGFTGDITPISPGAVPLEEHVLVLANGSARRGEKAPGHLDDRSFAFDDTIETALRHGDPDPLTSIDIELGSTLIATGLPALRSLGSLADSRISPAMHYADDPFGVRYWVVTWECGQTSGTVSRSVGCGRRG